MTEPDWGHQYTLTTEALLQLVAGLTPWQWEQRVAATPDWTVHDVIAHTAGTPADFLAGNMAGAPSAEWTQAHVDARREATPEQLIEECRASTPLVAPRLNARLAAFCFDRATHYADLCEFVGRRPEPEHWRPLLESLSAVTLKDRTLDVDDYELFRGLVSRRSMAQMRAWNTGLSDAELEDLGLFGPREDDQPIPR